MVTKETLPAQPLVSVIVPARNEEASLADCLHSLTTQTGVLFEIIVVDDHSTDCTREVAASFPGVKVIEAGPLPAGWTGKNNAVTAGAQAARGAWLLFTDADTVHLPGSLAAALKEAQENGAEMLSYSPEQIAVTFWEMATLPVVFAELARQYSPSKVSDPASTLAAANGQYILIRRDTYEAVGGHGAIAGDILEDVALARAVKSSGRRIRFRYGANAVRTRMYRNYRQLRDGWTKNLALLFPKPRLAGPEDVSVVGIISCCCAFLAHAGPARRWLDWNRLRFLYLFSAGDSCRETLRTMEFPRRSVRHAHVRLFTATLEASPCQPQGLLERPNLRSERTRERFLPSRTHYCRTTLMKLILALIIPTILSLELSSPVTPPGIRGVHPVVAIISQDTEAPALSSQTLIEPGARIGPLKLGDSRDRALELFPKKSEDQEWDDKCGGSGSTTLDWVDATNPTGHGDLLHSPQQKRQDLPDRICYHPLSHCRRHHYLRSRRQSGRELQRPPRLHVANTTGPCSRRPPARLLDRQEERHRLRLRVLSQGAQALRL